jgi:hypothetical protein
MYIALIVLVYIVAVFVLLSPFSWNSLIRKSRKHVDSRPYRAISLICESEQCNFAAEIKNRRFLQGQVPVIPPSGCAADQCGCRYVHHEDRRSAKDRRLEARRSDASGGIDKRGLRGRRKSDWSLLAVSG